MPPKVKITKESIIEAAKDLVRVGGAAALNARSIADALNVSTQPIFSNFSSMEELKLAVVARAEEIFAEFIEREVRGGIYPEYKASGMAYIRFAKEERELFKLLYMRDRAGEKPCAEGEINERMFSLVSGNTGLLGDDAKYFHLEMWGFVHGIASMIATGFFDIDMELAGRMISDVYQGLRNCRGLEK
jgi:AcrR family transcriptional regulator